MRPLLTIIALAGVALFLLGLHFELKWLTLLSKPVPMLCLLLWLRQAPVGTYRRWIADLFVFGLGAFLLAHLAYLVAYLSDSRRLAPLDLLIAALAAGGMFFVLASTGLGPLLLPVALYSLAIGAMLWRALARIGVVGASSAWLAAGGAALFVLSDSLIGINRFVAPFDGASYAIILSYWLGQLGIAASAVTLLARPAQLDDTSSAAPSISRR
jgi:alkenylglycerophosphocholine/alkenylglycerophosphoethanolamine hydrolase